ncbi:YciI family protein [Streptomyces johnsoniae]|uniref:YciI family protein n=1 Tax=Streptomyces johnsoniae TaxID=3075532 RepID=A0ABU2RXG3_9ACTN|nr:YciI family protein [Streptomyces sp. DSM 41886]MDT0441443.1 YciI family protein [Streptomyces sp. DSM 41886]
MPVFAVTYTYVDDAAALDRHRPVHRDYLRGLVERGVNLSSGPWGADERPGALLLIRADTKDAALACTEQDPFRVAGLVAEVTATEWRPVMGRLAEDAD